MAITRIKVLDGLRGLAALSVVLFHYTWNFRDDTQLPFSDKYDFIYGHYGVELFFIISGFVIYMTVEKCKSVNDFIYRRFIRLFPTYWVCIIFSIGAVKIFGLSGREVSWLTTAVNFTMLQSILGAQNVDGSYWSLFIELCFYTIIGILFKIKLLNRIVPISMILWTIGAIIFIYYPFNIGKFLLLQKGYGALFFSGILFYKLFKKDYKNQLLIHLLIVTNFLVVLSAQSLEEGKQFCPIIIVIPYILFYLFIYGYLEILTKTIFQFLGRISYPLYLLHLNIGYIIINYLISINMMYSPLFLLIPVAILFLLAWLVTDFIEKPIIQKIRKMIY